MQEIQYYVIDTETNGLCSKNHYHEINEISIIRHVDKVQLSKQVVTIHPERSSIDALRVCKKTLDDLRIGIQPSESVDICNKFLESDGAPSTFRCIVGHNIINFDRKFLWQHWEAQGKLFPADLWLDTMEMARFWVKKNELKQANGKKALVNLMAVCETLGLKKFAGVHAAKADVRNTYSVWQEFIKLGVDHLKFMKNLPHLVETNSNDDELLDL